MPLGKAALTRSQFQQAGGERGGDLFQRLRGDARGGEFQRQRNAFQLTANLLQRLGVAGQQRKIRAGLPHPIQKQRGGGKREQALQINGGSGRRERRDFHNGLARDFQTLAARYEQREIRNGLQQAQRQRGDLIQQMLRVIRN